MRVLLSTLNAKYIHSSLAMAYLYAYCKDGAWDMEIKEYSINENLENIMAEIFRKRPDVLAFSCYIWNIEYILQLCADFKKISPQTCIVLGGPEVSYDPVSLLKKHQEIDFIIRGEGEITLKELLRAFCGQGSFKNVKGITYRQGDYIYHNDDRELIDDLDIIPSPYNRENIRTYYKDKIIYYETSRGCPFNCSYCLSSTMKGVRYFSLERVKKDLLLFMEEKVKEVKLVDRTFNCNEERAREIMEFILENNSCTRFHFEIGAELLSDEMIDFLKGIPPGIFDFEIGIQSTCEKTLQAINRRSNWQVLKRKIKELIISQNIHIHLDLIAGLPFEDYITFKKSFNDVYNLEPDVIQLGFLKLLKGSPIRHDSCKYGYLFQNKPPYQVLKNYYISYEELIKLKEIEELIEKYYNSGIAKNTLKYLVEKMYQNDAFIFYEKMADFWEERELFDRSHKREAEYMILRDFILREHEEDYFAVELLKYDYFLNNHAHNLPSGFVSFNPDNAGEILYKLLKNRDFIKQTIPEWEGKTAREIRRYVHLEYLQDNTIYKKNCFCKIIPVLFIYNPVRKKAEKVVDVSSFL
ncbi:B12-binding domain-containing radical SAM protein [Thermosyntropha sp.]|uniref:B12-binding domain-containing radical SAM protein n=1 Tax=Thermosyntropha sp. TaxID=2740820 RepID=UPI0025D0093F|nr:B12-binding domain-containing radical SAM protein [Thermosyntropha sp.]MBO8158393.1 B12-binding domain-containing radical SAM protein [Thermosyntropha sp.]